MAGLLSFFVSNKRKELYHRIGTTLRTVTWSDSVASEVHSYELKEMPPKWSSLEEDLLTVQLFRKLEMNYSPIKVRGDGNCLFRSLSLSFLGMEQYHEELRVRAAVYMYNNANNFSSPEFYSKVYQRTITLKDMQQIVFASVSDCEQTLEHSIRSRAIAVLKPGIYGSMLEIIALSQLLNINIDVLYPCTVCRFTKRELFSGSLYCNDNAKSVIVSWTHTSRYDIESGNWIPNHFVPCQLADSKSDTGTEKMNESFTESVPVEQLKKNIIQNRADCSSSSVELNPKKKKKIILSKTEDCCSSEEECKPAKQVKKPAKFKPDWCIEFDYVRPSKNNEFAFYCNVCHKDVQNSHQGRADVVRHGNGARHMANLETMQTQLRTQKTIGAFLESDQKRSCNELVIRAEVKLSNWAAQHNIPFRPMQCLQKVLKDCFKDSAILNAYQCSRTKTAQVIAATARHHREELIQKMANQPFSIAVDGSNDQGLRKMYPITVRVYDIERTSIVSGFLDMCPISGSKSSTAEEIFRNVSDTLTMVCDEKPWHNCVAVGLDNTNVNIGRNNSFKSRLNMANPTIYIQGCPCHIIHNTAKHGSNEMKKRFFDVEELLNDIYFWFDKSSKRKNDCKEFTEDCEIEYRKILKHVSTRWLSIGRSVTRTLQLYIGLKSYFLSIDGKEDCARLKRLKAAFSDEMTEVYLLFIQHAVAKFDCVNLLLQREDPCIHILYDNMLSLYQQLLTCFISPATLRGYPMEKYTDIDLLDSENYLEDSDIKIGFITKKKLDAINPTPYDRKKFVQAARTYHLFTAKYAKKWFPLDDELLKRARFLHFPYRTIGSFDDVMYFAERYKEILNSECQPNYLDRLDLEYSSYACISDEYMQSLIKATLSGENLNNWSRTKELTDVQLIWKCLKEEKLGNGMNKYGLLCEVAQLVLTIPHSNASEERAFSQTKKNLTDERSNLDPSGSLNNLMVVKNAPGLNPCHLYEPSVTLLAAAKSATAEYNEKHNAQSNIDLARS